MSLSSQVTYKVHLIRSYDLEDMSKQVKHGIDAKHIQTSRKHLKTRMQHDNMKLYAKSSKFHIEHTQNGATVQHIHYTSLKDKLSKTATRHLASIKTICYRTSTRKQKAWAWCTGKAWQNINTELSPEITRTCSKRHSKIANNNSFRLCRNNIRLQCLALSNNMLQELIMAKKGMEWIY